MTLFRVPSPFLKSSPILEELPSLQSPGFGRDLGGRDSETAQAPLPKGRAHPAITALSLADLVFELDEHLRVSANAVCHKSTHGALLGNVLL